MPTKNKRRKDYLVWIDCEMTGLEPDTDALVEIATIITDSELNIVDHGPEFAIHQSAARLRKMNPWSRRTHRESGLIDRIRTEGIPLAEAEHQTLNFVRKHCYAKSAPLCGNTVWQDKAFLRQHMPRLYDFFHYRIVDVSSVKILASNWFGKKCRPPQKQGSHRALQDIEESIEELKYYRTLFTGKKPK